MPSFRKRIEKLVNDAADDIVHHEEVRRDQKNKSDHHRRRRAHLFPGWPGDLAHFHLQIFEIILHARRPTRRPLRKRHLFCCHISSAAPGNPVSRLSAATAGRDGRGGGIRTPTRGFGDRWSAVKPTPLHLLVYLISLWGWCLRQNGQNFFNSRRSVVVFLFFMLL